MGGTTTGGPLAFYIENTDHEKWRGVEVEPMTVPRPGHVDLPGVVKYGFGDIRPALERASARETALRVAVGAVCKHFLSQFAITIGGYVQAIGDVAADCTGISYQERLLRAEENDVRCPDSKAIQEMRQRIDQVILEQDTLGGLLEVVALGVPPGLGSFTQWDRRLDARIGAALLSIQAIKGIEIGNAWENARLKGTQAQDAIILQPDGENLSRLSNRAGGIEGGISNGQPIVIRVAMKPIATTITPQLSVDLSARKPTSTQYERSDFCPVPRTVPILEAMLALVLTDALINKLGGDSINEMLPRFAKLRKASLEDLNMDNQVRKWWE